MNDTATYSVLFNETSKNFSEEKGLNQITLNMVQAYCNDKLRMQGHLFLNEVLDRLCLPRTREGQTAGWVWKKYQKDSCVDLGITDLDFLQGKKFAVMLNFNARPDILDDVFGSVS